MDQHRKHLPKMLGSLAPYNWHTILSKRWRNDMKKSMRQSMLQELKQKHLPSLSKNNYPTLLAAMKGKTHKVHGAPLGRSSIEAS